MSCCFAGPCYGISRGNNLNAVQKRMVLVPLPKVIRNEFYPDHKYLNGLFSLCEHPDAWKPVLFKQKLSTKTTLIKLRRVEKEEFEGYRVANIFEQWG